MCVCVCMCIHNAVCTQVPATLRPQVDPFPEGDEAASDERRSGPHHGEPKLVREHVQNLSVLRSPSVSRGVVELPGSTARGNVYFCILLLYYIKIRRVCR